MRTVAAAVQARLLSVGPPSVRCWLVTLTTGAVIAITKHTRDLVVDGTTYLAQGSGVLDTALDTSEGTAVDNLELSSFLTRFQEGQIEAGEFDGARVEVFDVDPLNVSEGKVPIALGIVGAVRIRDGQATVEVRGPAQLLQRKIGEVYQKRCPVPLGSARCGIELHDVAALDEFVADAAGKTFTADSTNWPDLGFAAGDYVEVVDSGSNDGTFTVASAVAGVLTVNETVVDETAFFTVKKLSGFLYTGTIATVDAGSPRRIFTTTALAMPDSSTPPAGWFQEGNIRFTDGNNATAGARLVQKHSGVSLTLYDEFPYDVEVGDAFILETGCDKLPGTCKTKFDNFANFQGFPDVPTPEEVFDSPVAV